MLPCGLRLRNVQPPLSCGDMGQSRVYFMFFYTLDRQTDRFVRKSDMNLDRGRDKFALSSTRTQRSLPAFLEIPQAGAYRVSSTRCRPVCREAGRIHSTLLQPRTQLLRVPRQRTPLSDHGVSVHPPSSILRSDSAVTRCFFTNSFK